MKKLLYCAAALATVFFAGSCQRENLEPVANGGVTYTITLPEIVQTKGADGYAEYDLYVEVYKTVDAAALEDATLLFEKHVEMTDNPTSVGLDLLNDQDYTILFWANKKGEAWFNTADLRNVQMVQSASNNEDRDAYCAMDQIVNHNGTITKKVDLKRPFAQINVATLVPTVQQIGYDVTPVSSRVTVSDIPVAYNVAKGMPVGNDVLVDYTVNLIPSGNLEGTDYKKVAMNYVLVPEGTVDVYYEINTANGTVKNTVANVPVKANYRTNIIGNLLTSNATYTVEIKPGFDTDGKENMFVENEGVVKNVNGDYEISNAKGLAYALNNLFVSGGNFYLTASEYDMTGLEVNAPTIPAGVVLNIYGETPVVTRAALNGVVITGLDFGALIEEVAESASVSFANITLESDVPFVNENNGAVAFTDCANDVANSNEEAEALVAGGNGKVVDMVAITTLEELQNAINDGVKAITLSGNLGNNKKEFTLELKGATVNAVDNSTGSYGLITNQSNLKVVGPGMLTLSATTNREWNAYSSVISNTVGGNLTLEGGVVIEHLGGTDMAYGIDNLTNGKGTSAVTTINGATIKSTYTSVRQFLNGVEATNELIVKAGSRLESTNRAIFFQDPSANPNTGKLVVEEGAELYGDVRLSVTAGSTEWPVIVSVAASALKDGEVTYQNVPEGYAVANVNGTWKVISDVASVNGQVYSTLADAVDAVEDGGTVTLLMNVVFTEETRMSSGSGWYEGLYYVGDKSFTIDLNNHSITQNGAVNDYLFLFKNEGGKENVITFKNGTLDAGTSAYCALCTSTLSTQKITLNAENLEIIGNNSNGAVCKIRGGVEFNVKAGTKIIGKNSYLGIENWNAVVNIYDGAEIYMNGTSSYNGCLVGVGGNGTVNVYGGYGKGVSGGLIAMTSGGTINAMGGEWIANTDGTFANSNKSVLIAQSDKQYNAGAGNAVVNVTGGTYKGGYNCYGNAVGDAQINISGGNFNADPTTYLVNNYKADESNGIWTVVVDPVASVGDVEYATLEEAAAAAKAGDTITVLRDATLTEEVELPANITFNGNGKQINGSIYAGGNLTFAGHTKVTSFSAAYYNRTITIGEGACLEVNGGGRVSLAYGNIFNIKGNISDAKTADKTEIQPSLIIPAGISITGGNDAAMNVTNAYVQIGSTTSKPGAASGTFSFNFVNSIVEFTKEFGFYEPTGGKNPEFNMNLSNTVMTTGAKLCIAASNSTVVADNSIIALATYLRNSGNIELKNGSVLTGSTIQFGENGGNNGAITVDNSEFTITAGSTAQAFDGKGVGSITVKNGATANVDYYKDMTITVDETSTFITKVQ